MNKEKQIEEIANVIYDDPNAYDTYWRSHCERLAETIYNAGYRKHSEGEWIKVAAYNDGILNTIKCSVCNTFMPIGDWDRHPYCPFCGAKMKGGAK